MTESTAAPVDENYFEGIRAGLDAAFARAPKESFDPRVQRIAIFSDHHKGAGDPADDFRRCEHAYSAALGYYLEAGYRLFVLGDAEELWEERSETVIDRYGSVLELEAEFVSRGNGLDRFFGNHDDQWASSKEVEKHLHDALGRITVREGLRLVVERPGKPPGTLFFVHGHQGTRDSDRWKAVSRLFVRHVWRPIQRRTGFSATSPSRDYELRARHDQAMFTWASAQTPGLILIAGHTHRPVFARSKPAPPPTRPVAELEEALQRATAEGDTATAATVRVELEYARTARRRPEEVFQVKPPCYSTPVAAHFQTATSRALNSPMERSGSYAGPAISARSTVPAWASRPRSASSPSRTSKTYSRRSASHDRRPARPGNSRSRLSEHSGEASGTESERRSGRERTARARISRLRTTPNEIRWIALGLRETRSR